MPVSKERSAKVSWNTPHVDLKFTLRSLTQVTVLHFVLRLIFYQAHVFLKCLQKKKFNLSSGNGFLFCNLSCTRNLTKPHCFGEENEKIFPGPQPPDPLPSSDTTQTPPPTTSNLKLDSQLNSEDFSRGMTENDNIWTLGGCSDLIRSTLYIHCQANFASHLFQQYKAFLVTADVFGAVRRAVGKGNEKKRERERGRWGGGGGEEGREGEREGMGGGGGSRERERDH